MTPTQEKLSAKNAELAALNIEIAKFQSSYKSWNDAANSSNCSKLIGSKKKACEDDVAYKRSMAESALKQVDALVATRTSLLSEIDSLKASVAAENQAAVNLSQQGLSQAALIVKAEGDAKAAQTIADAQARATTTTAETDNKNKQLIIGAIVIVVVIAGILIVKRIAKAKKKK